MSHRKSSTPRTRYESTYKPELKKILRQQGDGDLFNEIELLRYGNLQVLQHLKSTRKKMSLHDTLAVLRAFSHSSGRIAHITKIQFTVFTPYAELQAAHKQTLEGMETRLQELAEIVMGEEQVGHIRADSLMQIFRGEGGPQK